MQTGSKCQSPPRRAGSAQQVLLSLGSNIAPEQNLPAAVDMLSDAGRLVAVSQAWQSQPVGYLDQDDFVNAAVWLETEYTAPKLLGDVIPRIERRLKRVRDPANKNAPRTIDVDMSLFNSDVGSVLGRNIPDPDILTRLFVAWPLAQIAGAWVHPVTGDTLGTIARRLEQQGPSLTLRRDIQLAPRS